MSSDKFRILSIDGGGLRGVIPIQVIKYIEKISGKEIHNLFDLIVGTSTGGILACTLTMQDDLSLIANRRKFNLDKIEEIYKERGKEIFYTPGDIFRKKIFELNKWIKPKFSHAYLNDILVEYFGNVKLTNCLKPIMVISYDLHRNKPIQFSFREASLFPERNPSLVEICMAASAAPTYFPTYDFIHDNERLSCIDGGIFMNNPSFGAINEVLAHSDYEHYKINGKNLTLSDISVLSLGTGYVHEAVDSNKSKYWGRLQWIKPIIDLTMNAPNRVVDYHVKSLYKSFDKETQYLRVDLNIPKEYSELSDSSIKTTEFLIDKMNSELNNNHTLNKAIKIFVSNL